MAETSKGDLKRELASLRKQLQEMAAALAKRRQNEEDLQLICADLTAEVERLKIDLQKSQRGQAQNHSLAVPSVGIASEDSQNIRVANDPEQLADHAHTARLQTMGEIACDLAHELNQPVAAIATYSQAALQLLESGIWDEQEVTQLLQRVAGQAERAGNLIRRIRRFAGRGQPEFAPVAINDIVREAIALIESELQKHDVRTCLQLAEDLPKVLADQVQIGQVLLNLIRNAIEAMHDTPVGQRVLTITTQASDRGVQAAVSDAGAGLSVAVVRNLFAAFHTTKPTGMGLGLAISRAIIQAHNGRMWVKPNPQRGTTFFFELLLSQT